LIPFVLVLRVEADKDTPFSWFYGPYLDEKNTPISSKNKNEHARPFDDREQVPGCPYPAATLSDRKSVV
jgi:hypothetical protein